MTQQTVRLGYIGAGKFSQRRLLPNLKPLPAVELTAVSNSSRESGQKIADEFGFQRVSDDWREIVAASDIDAVVIGTRPDLRKEISLAALDAGKHVLALNAIATSIDEAKAMHQKAQEKPDLVTLVFPGQFWLREDAVMRHLLEQGTVGRLLQVVVYWYTPFFGLGSQFEVARRWFGHHTRMFGARQDLGVELPPTSSTGRAVRASSNTVLAELESGGAVTYLHSTVAGSSGLTRFEVYGTEGTLVCYAARQSREGFYGAKAGESELQPIPIPPAFQEVWADPRDLPLSIEADFIAAVRGEKTPSPAIPSFGDGVKLLEFADAWRQTTERATWVDLPLA